MSQLHPVFEMALAPFITPATQARLDAPKRSKYAGLTQFDYCPRGTDIELACWIEFQHAERPNWDEPGCAAEATLCLAEINGTDILEILSEATVAEIETAFLEQDGDE